MNEMSNQAAAKKKSKKRKKGKSGKGTDSVFENDQQLDKTPKQVTGKGDPVITTTKCGRCKGTFRQMNDQVDTASTSQGESWTCPSCVQEIKSERESAHSPLPTRAVEAKELEKTQGTSGCNCSACVAKRENAVSPEVERDAHITQTYWMEVRHAVRCIYRDNVSLTKNKTSTIGSDRMQMIVKKLCNRDPHQFFQRLETLAREYLLEVKVRLLEQLSCGFNTPQLAIEFIQMLLEEYSTLCNAMPALLYLLKPLEACDYIQKLGMTVELMNKNIFRELIFSESFMSSNLPLIIGQLHVARHADYVHGTTAQELCQRYVTLDHEMDEISQIWKSAKDHLRNHDFEERKNRLEEIKSDGESFKRQVKLQQSIISKDGDSAKSKHEEKSVSVLKSVDKPYSDCEEILNPGPIQRLLQSKISENGVNENVLCNTEQTAEWARLLYKCVKPSADAEFSLDGDVATHTITLHLDTTLLDLKEAKPCCSRPDLIKYQRLGLEVEEIVEVAMKLSSLKNLGLSIKIEDLFDDEGFSLSAMNGKVQESGGVSFEDCNSDELTSEEEIDLERAKERILQRHDASLMSLLLPNGGKTRHQDFLRGLTIKIRFRKTLSVDDLDKHFISDDGKVTFHYCDQVQMKLTHIEMNSACLSTSCNAVGDNLGMEKYSDHLTPSPVNTVSKKTPEDYVFMHTKSHHEFMDLLLEKRKQLEETIISNEKERRLLCTGMNGTERAALPRYQVQEQQESSTTIARELCLKESSSGMLKNNFKPFFYTQDSRPCQCSACVGAMATIITSTFHHTPSMLDQAPSAMSLQCSLKTHLGVDKHQSSPESDKDLLTTSHVDCSTGSTAPSHACTSPLSKEGLWQNWMSTSGSAQLESESHITNTNEHYHHHSGSHCCHCGENAQVSGDRSKVCNYHEADTPLVSTGDCSSTGICSHHHNSSAKEGEGKENPSLNSANGASNSGEIPRRYCPCCYCELFGHNAPPTAPTSHNYTKRRDIMRQKLEEKKKRRKEDKSEQPNGVKDEEQQTSVEELLAFIEGGDGEDGDQPMASKLSKRQRKKLKKLHDLGNGDCLFHHDHESVEYVEMDKDQSAARTEIQINPKRKKHSQSVLEEIRNTTKSKERKTIVESADLDEYEDELEEFKRFCFADAPTGPRKKIPITLNMHDIMSKLSN